jgi:hypothetical protein
MSARATPSGGLAREGGSVEGSDIRCDGVGGGVEVGVGVRVWVWVWVAATLR